MVMLERIRTLMGDSELKRKYTVICRVTRGGLLANKVHVGYLSYKGEKGRESEEGRERGHVYAA